MLVNVCVLSIIQYLPQQSNALQTHNNVCRVCMRVYTLTRALVYVLHRHVQHTIIHHAILLNLSNLCVY